MTQQQQLKLMRRCEDLLWTDPTLLLVDDKYLLDIDFEALGDGPAIDRQIWISEMEAASVAAGVVDLPHTDTTRGTAQLDAPVDTEGSIRFRRRRRRTHG